MGGDVRETKYTAYTQEDERVLIERMNTAVRVYRQTSNTPSRTRSSMQAE